MTSLLLDLPAELRLQIYDAVLDVQVDCQVIRRTSPPPSRPGRSKHFTHLLQLAAHRAGQFEATPTLSIPWLNFLLVCKTITAELGPHMAASKNMAYELEVDGLDRRYNSSENKSQVTWRKIPCPPSSVCTLRATLVFDLGTSFGGRGGSTPTLSELYQALRCFVRNGPQLGRRSELEKQVHLNTLIVRIRVRESDPDRKKQLQGVKVRAPYDIGVRKQRLRSGVEGYLSAVVQRCSILSGAVDRIVYQWA
ncbi:hypothetical protein MSAN_01943600 [Mycena sanguinolenta]|uniref:Uncharacterized protein n=1 Tax=Mycena sanguinolenta TaxID=230812 RepID=A0A8H6XMT1_9AGAR|nr:hypothetical protein MSAN_01943600 [Mycena sanguinolenta]